MLIKQKYNIGTNYQFKLAEHSTGFLMAYKTLPNIKVFVEQILSYNSGNLCNNAVQGLNFVFEFIDYLMVSIQTIENSGVICKSSSDASNCFVSKYI